MFRPPPEEMQYKILSTLKEGDRHVISPILVAEELEPTWSQPLLRYRDAKNDFHADDAADVFGCHTLIGYCTKPL